MQNFSALSAYSDSVLSQSLSLTRWAHPIQSLIQRVLPMVIPGATQESNKNPSQTGLQQIRCWGLLLLLLNCHCIHFIDESWSVCQIDLSQRADAKVAHWCGPLVILQQISKFTMLQHTHVLLSRLGKHQAYDHMQPRFWTWDDHSCKCDSYHLTKLRTTYFGWSVTAFCTAQCSQKHKRCIASVPCVTT